MAVFDSKKIAVTISTYYPKWYKGKLRSIKHTDKIRGDLALEFIHKALKIGLCVIAVDGNSTKSYQKELKSIPNLIYKPRKSPKRSPAKRLAFQVASKIKGVQVIIATEPEKITLLDYVDKITKPILQNKAQIVIPQRDKKLFEKTYPKYMFESEIEGNQMYNEYLQVSRLLPKDQNYDLFFGARVFKNDPKVLSLFMKKFNLKIGKAAIPNDFFDVEEYSNASFFPIVLALKKKFKIEAVTIPFSYPKLQKQNEEVGERKLFIEKRKNQRLSLILELVYFLNMIKK